MNRNCLLELLAFLFLLQSVFAVHGIALTSPRQSFYLEEQTALNVVYGIANHSGERVCFSAHAHSSEANLDASVASQEFCLNDNEQTKITLTLIAKDGISSGSYTVTLEVEHDLGRETNTLNVIVEEMPFIRFSDEPKNEYCTTESIVIPITLHNDSAEEQRIEVEANAPAFLPFLEESLVVLGAGEEKELLLRFHTNSSTQTGEFEYTLTVRTQDLVSTQKFSFKTVECKEEPSFQAKFSLVVPSTCINISPGKTKTNSFSLENTGNTLLTLWFSLFNNSGLKWKLDSSSPVTLQEGKSVRMLVEITAPAGIKEGLHKLFVTAATTFFRNQKFFCVIVAKPFSFDLIPNNVSIEQDNTFGIALSVHNKWSSRQTISLSVETADPATNVSFEDTSLSLDAYEEETVMATIETDSNIALGGHHIEFKARNSNGQAKQTLFFSVIPSPLEPPVPLQDTVLEFLAYPTFIDLNVGESKELSFALFNDSNETVKDIQVLFSGLPEGLSFIGPPSFDLEPQSVLNVRGLIRANATLSKSIDAKVALMARNPRFFDVKRVRMRVSLPGEAEKPPDLLSGFITGLIGLRNNAFWIGLIFLLVLLAFYNVASWSKDHQTYCQHKERWQRVSAMRESH